MNNFKVEILNREEVQKIFKSWGTAACVCYKTPEKFAERVGKSCLTTGHFSGSRGDYIKFKISGVPRALIDQIARHEQGVYKNIQSQRYTDMSNFDYYISPKLKGEALELYIDTMAVLSERYIKIVELLNNDGIMGESANEIARGIIPMNANGELVIGFTLEALINLCHKRLCVCSQDHIRKLVGIMRKQVVELIPELEEHLVAICQSQLWCPESPKRTCGAFPQKSELKDALKLLKVHKNLIKSDDKVS